MYQSPFYIIHKQLYYIISYINIFNSYSSNSYSIKQVIKIYIKNIKTSFPYLNKVEIIKGVPKTYNNGQPKLYQEFFLSMIGLTMDQHRPILIP